jgi:hypothetical protein
MMRTDKRCRSIIRLPDYFATLNRIRQTSCKRAWLFPPPWVIQRVRCKEEGTATHFCRESPYLHPQPPPSFQFVSARRPHAVPRCARGTSGGRGPPIRRSAAHRRGRGPPNVAGGHRDPAGRSQTKKPTARPRPRPRPTAKAKQRHRPPLRGRRRSPRRTNQAPKQTTSATQTDRRENPNTRQTRSSGRR